MVAGTCCRGFSAPVLLGGCLLLSGCDGTISPSDVRLDLHEVSAHPLPDSFPVSYVAASADGSVALISPHWSHLLVGKEGVFSEFGVGLLDTPIAARLDGGLITEIVDAGARAIISVDEAGVATKTPIQMRIRITSAVHVPERGWLVSGVDSAGAVVIYEPQSGTRHALINLRKFPNDSLDSAILTASPSGEFILIRPRRPGFWAILSTDRSWAIRRVFDGRSAHFRRRNDQIYNPMWVAAGMVPVSDHFLYTVADLRSEDRLLLLLTSRGRLVRTTEINAPIGFVSGIPGQSLVLAIRKVGSQELVTYEWHWGGDTTITSNRDGEHEISTNPSTR